MLKFTAGLVATFYETINYDRLLFRETRVGELLKRGVSRNYAVTTGCARKGPWRMSKVKWVNIALPDDHFESLGLSFPWI